MALKEYNRNCSQFCHGECQTLTWVSTLLMDMPVLDNI